MKIKINLSTFHSLDNYAALEKEAEDKAFEYSVSLKIKHQPRDYSAIWEINGEQEDVESFMKNLELTNHLKN